ncbi:murein transglycosylase [Enterovibrio sp. ZSDZ35]|uniref:Murein transglycosylase n=1 Tax=Enterovibrio qingdaonensis TaxID=2899818 RepID=A0ABT5QU24_9GAMM|nr:murein transglycosylase [Enterovibrio sp. ZSDZ35]MDD1784094.1 murein transglycosylase [Enterovibrio sp. ZSDZ35]
MPPIENSIITNACKKSAVGMRRIVSVCFAALVSVQATASFALSIDDQRTKYEEAVSAIKRNDINTFKKLKRQLEDYPLYPYLEYRDFTRSLSSAKKSELDTFLDTYSDLPFIGTVRGRYIDTLASKRQWKSLLAFQPNVPRGERYQCQYYYAHSQAGDKALAFSGAKSLYLSGTSVDSACDKLFDVLKKSGKLNNALVLDRMLLAFDKRNRSLMRYLQKQLTGSDAQQGKQVIALYDNPRNVATFSKKSKVTSLNQRLTRLTFERLARTNVSEAVKQFKRTTDGQHFDQYERQEMADYVASRLMSTDKAALEKWRDHWLSQTANQSLLERRFRVALVDDDWKDMSRWLSAMSEKEQDKIKWRYWQARITQEQHGSDAAKEQFTALLGERNFYSVAAAMHLGAPIDIPYQTTSLNIETLQPFRPALSRISELLILDKVSAAKREWQNVLSQADQQEKAMLAAFATDSKWYHLSVQATISGKMWGHLEYRFPVAHRWWFEFFSKERDLPLTTLLALSRQESAFYTNAVSPVGARGLMQLMPATAKETSKKLGFRYLGKSTLSDPGINIRLGSGYLRMLLDQFDENRILAFAAYNAGPHRANKWLKESDGNLDAIAFIEAIPFRETRGYVQNVLMYDIYYRKLLGLPLQFLHDSEMQRRY